MYEKLDDVTLKTGEKVELGVVMGPDLEWADRIDADLLAHKGGVWQWGNEKVLRESLELEAYFYILHRDGTPFANVMNIEYKGVGILGHVYTRPEERQQGACAAIFRGLMPHFKARGGQALVLGTDFDSPPYHIYKAFGFAGIEPHSGTMAYYAESQAVFDAAYFAKGPVVVARLAACHYPVAPVLFVGSYPGLVRSVVMGLFGKSSSEGPLLRRWRDELERIAEDQGVQTAVLKQQETEAVLGVATWGLDAVWPGQCLVDIYCHPEYWSWGDDLLAAIVLPKMHRYVAYCDVGFAAKEAVLEGAGFERVATLAGWVPVDRAETAFADVGVWERK